MKFVCCLVNGLGNEVLTCLDEIDKKIVADWLAIPEQELPDRITLTGQEAIRRLGETLSRHGERVTLLPWVKGCSVNLRTVDSPLINCVIETMAS